MRRRLVWLLAAAALFALAAWLMLRGEEEEKVSSVKDRVSLPKRMDESDRQRANERATWVPKAAPDAGAPTFAQMRPRDPLLAALHAKQGESAVVVEANAIRNSKLGELLVACMNRRGGLDRFVDETGVDPTKDIDRIAAVEGAVVVTGNFAQQKLPESISKVANGKAYGDHATIYRRGENGVFTLSDGGTRVDDTAVVMWNQQMMMVAQNEEAAKEIIDRLEGRVPAEDSVITDSMAYGEMYGVISAKDLSRMLPDDQQALKDTLQDAAARIELHADTMTDVGIVADVNGPDSAKVQDLGKSLGAALAIARMQASSEGKNDLADLMDLAKVVTKDGQFRIELALPMEMLEQRLAFCRAPYDGGVSDEE